MDISNNSWFVGNYHTRFLFQDFSTLTAYNFYGRYYYTDSTDVIVLPKP